MSPAARRAALAFCAMAALAGCGNLSDTNTAANSAGPVSGALVGLGVGGITANPLVGYAAGVGTQAAITALQKYLFRKLHQGEQDKIAGMVGAMQPGQHAPWKISYLLPIGSEHGDVTVTRVIQSSLAVCKEAAFSIVAGNKPNAPRALFITTACQEPGGVWKWAEAEPAVSRWGFLQ